MEIRLSVIWAGFLRVRVFPVCCFANYMYALRSGFVGAATSVPHCGLSLKVHMGSRGVGGGV